MVIVQGVKFFIFFIAFLNKAVGRESADVAGPFSDMCGPKHRVLVGKNPKR